MVHTWIAGRFEPRSAGRMGTGRTRGKYPSAPSIQGDHKDKPLHRIA